MTGRRALFLDRDGVIIEDAGFLVRADELRLLEGAAEAIASIILQPFLALGRRELRHGPIDRVLSYVTHSNGVSEHAFER